MTVGEYNKMLMDSALDPPDRGCAKQLHLDAFGQEIEKGDIVIQELYSIFEGKIKFYKVMQASPNYKMIKIKPAVSTETSRHQSKSVYANTVYKPTGPQLTYAIMKNGT